MAYTQYLKELKSKLPNKLIMLSPWLDLTSSNPEIELYKDVDLLLNFELLVKMAAIYSDGDDLQQYKLSPLYGDLEGLPKMSVFIGTDELLYPDVQKLTHQLDYLDIAYNSFVYAGMYHVWMSNVDVPESKTALAQIVAVINDTYERDTNQAK